jgi:hypothetical protein
MMNVSDKVFSEMVEQAKEIRKQNPEQSLDTVAMVSINNVLDAEGVSLSNSELGDTLFQVVYAMREG